MVLCVVPGCGSRSERDKGIGYYRIPSVITNKGEFEEELTTEHRNEWIKAIGRGDTDTKQVLASERVCGKHFVNGQPAPYWNKYHEDWVPTLILGKKKYGTKINFEAQAKRDERSRKREKLARERQERESAEKRQKLYESSLPVVEIDFSQSSSSRTFEGSQDKGEEGLNEETLFADVIVTEGEGENRKDAGCQTTSDTTEYQEAECQTTEFEYMFQKSKYQAPSKYFFESDEKVRFYTGLPSQEVLIVVFNHVVPYVTRQTQSLDRFQEFVIVLIKLRLNPPLQDLAYRFAVAVSTISRIFFHWVVVMDERLLPFVYWPDRDHLWRTMPQCYQYAFAWGGRVSDKFLTENCGFLEKLIPGDMVMADRGFTITESVGLMQAKLVIPAFTKGKAQLDPVDVETTRGIANVRIHVERVIGLLRRKYTIFQSTLPTDFLICNHRYSDRHTPLVDSMLRVCAALVNFCPPIVPFD
uniref:Uncharacterized protein LOC116292043 n=1 Tax=Actinia tenebrosa TaxID=6105 RepID=A0A6P8HFF1_ACTTE